MFSCLTRLFNHIRYGKLVTEDYTGKVVRVYWSGRIFAGEKFARTYGDNLITVLQDDGKYNVAGPVFVRSVYQWEPINPKTGLVHARKGCVTVVANSVAEYEEAQRIKQTRKRSQGSVCSNETREIAVVTGYDGSTYSGRTLKGDPWKSKKPKCLATSYKDYTERCLDE